MNEQEERKQAAANRAQWMCARGPVSDECEPFIAGWLARSRLAPKGEPVAWECRKCRALWRKNPDGSWNCPCVMIGPCCNNPRDSSMPLVPLYAAPVQCEANGEAVEPAKPWRPMIGEKVRVVGPAYPGQTYPVDRTIGTEFYVGRFDCSGLPSDVAWAVSPEPMNSFRYFDRQLAPVPCAQSNENRNSAPPSPERAFLRAVAACVEEDGEFIAMAARRYLEETK